MKVLYLHECPSKGGSSTSLLNLITSFPKGTIEPLVCCPPGSSKGFFESHGIPVIPLDGIPTFANGRVKPMSGLNLLRIYRAFLSGYEDAFLNVLDSFDPDIVHLNDCNLLKPLKLAKSKGKKTVVHARCTLSKTPKWAWSYQTRTLRKYADKIIAIDQSVLSTLGEQPHSTVIYNPLAPKWEMDQKILGAKSPKNNLAFSEENPLRVGFVSLFYRWKGVFELLEAANLLKERKDITFIFAGSNGRPVSFHRSTFGKICHLLDLAPDVEKQIKEYISRYTLENVQLTGFIEDVSSMMRSLDVLAFPSRMDAVPRSVFEAGLFGIPSIISMETKIEDIVKDGFNGLIIPEKHPEVLAKAILRLAEDRDLLTSLGEKAKNQFAVQFNSSHSAQSVLNVYREIQGSC